MDSTQNYECQDCLDEDGCSTTFYHTKPELLNHYDAEHQALIQCPICQKGFYHRDPEYKTHMAMHQDPATTTPTNSKRKRSRYKIKGDIDSNQPEVENKSASVADTGDQNTTSDSSSGKQSKRGPADMNTSHQLKLESVTPPATDADSQHSTQMASSLYLQGSHQRPPPPAYISYYTTAVSGTSSTSDIQGGPTTTSTTMTTTKTVNSHSNTTSSGSSGQPTLPTGGPLVIQLPSAALAPIVYKCLACGVYYEDASMCLAHTHMHGTGDHLACVACGQTFTTGSRFYGHILMHHHMGF